MQHQPPVTPAMRRSRIATTAVFFVNGAALALFFSNIALIKDLIALSDAKLGTALGLQGLGTVIFVVIGSLVATRFGTRATMLFGAVAMALALQMIGFASGYVPFLIAVIALGASNSFIDVSMNAHASLVERDYRVEIMPSFHAAYNFGGFAGASLASHLIGATGGAYSSVTFAGVLMIGILLVGWLALGNLKPADIVEEVAEKRHVVAIILSTPAILILGVFVALALFVENSMNGWSGVYLKDVVLDDPAAAAQAFAAFQLATAFGRLAGARAIRLLGADRVMVISGIVGACGVLIAVSFINHWAALAGFALIGLGLSNCTPMFFTRAAAAFPSSPALGIALGSRPIDFRRLA